MVDPHIQVKNYYHFNRAMNKHISSKKQYNEEMKRGGYCTFEQAERIAAKKNAQHKGGYSGLSKNAQDIVNTVRQQNPKSFKLSDRAIDAMKSLGVKFERKGQYHYKPKGGFGER